ncbi:DMT family transporter [Nocardioides sp. NPDC023903]|uniref:DMT family transporter n=1 Tax=Nocardioides sp. NPDC023903 TaxID=3157195 RepID=UPI0033F6A180
MGHRRPRPPDRPHDHADVGAHGERIPHADRRSLTARRPCPRRPPARPSPRPPHGGRRCRDRPLPSALLRLRGRGRSDRVHRRQPRDRSGDSAGRRGHRVTSAADRPAARGAGDGADWARPGLGIRRQRGRRRPARDRGAARDRVRICVRAHHCGRAPARSAAQPTAGDRRRHRRRGLALTPLALLGGGPLVSPSATVWAWLVYLGVATMALAYGRLYAGLRTTPSSAATVASLMEPVAASVAAAAVLGERLAAPAVAGVVLILIAVAGLA